MCLIFKVILSVFLVNAAFADVSHVYGQPGQQYLQPFQQVDAQYPADVQQYAIPSQSDVEHEGYPDNQPELDNTVYDQNQYQDPIQQYANTYNPEGGLEPGLADPALAGGLIGGGPGVPGGFGGAPGGPGGFGGPGFGPGGFPYGPGAFGPGGFGVQTGYEGFLVPFAPFGPVAPIPPPIPPPVDLLAGAEGGPFGALTNLFPQARSIFAAIVRFFTFVLGLLGMTVVGGGITTAICTFTPICSISFAIPFLGGVRTFGKQLSSTLKMNEDPNEHIDNVAKNLQTAIVKLDNLQKEANEDQKPVEEVKEVEATTE